MQGKIVGAVCATIVISATLMNSASGKPATYGRLQPQKAAPILYDIDDVGLMAEWATDLFDAEISRFVHRDDRQMDILNNLLRGVLRSFTGLNPVSQLLQRLAPEINAYIQMVRRICSQWPNFERVERYGELSRIVDATCASRLFRIRPAAGEDRLIPIRTWNATDATSSFSNVTATENTTSAATAPVASATTESIAETSSSNTLLDDHGANEIPGNVVPPAAVVNIRPAVITTSAEPDLPTETSSSLSTEVTATERTETESVTTELTPTTSQVPASTETTFAPSDETKPSSTAGTTVDQRLLRDHSETSTSTWRSEDDVTTVEPEEEINEEVAQNGEVAEDGEDTEQEVEEEKEVNEGAGQSEEMPQDDQETESEGETEDTETGEIANFIGDREEDQQTQHGSNAAPHPPIRVYLDKSGILHIIRPPGFAPTQVIQHTQSIG